MREGGWNPNEPKTWRRIDACLGGSEKQEGATHLASCAVRFLRGVVQV